MYVYTYLAAYAAHFVLLRTQAIELNHPFGPVGHTESAQDCRTRGSEPTVAHHAWVSCKGCLKAKRALTVWVRCRRDTPLHRPGNIQEAPSTVWRSVSIRRVTYEGAVNKQSIPEAAPQGDSVHGQASKTHGWI